VTVGVGDGHPAAARSTGFVRLKVLPGVPGGVDDTDVRVRLNLTNVMHVSDLSEYTREIRGRIGVRLTDEDDATSETTADFDLGFTAPCVGTDSVAAATCDVATSLDALLPGSAPEHTRAIWGLDQIRVYDGGPDEDADTQQDNSLLAVQGVFVP